jgi:hypothetical protein
MIQDSPRDDLHEDISDEDRPGRNAFPTWLAMARTLVSGTGGVSMLMLPIAGYRGTNPIHETEARHRSRKRRRSPRVCSMLQAAVGKESCWSSAVFVGSTPRSRGIIVSVSSVGSR